MKELNMKTLKPLEENVGDYLYDFKIRKKILKKTHKPPSHKGNINKLH